MLKKLSKTIFYISFPLSFMAFILPLYVNDLGASPLEVGFLFSIFSFISIVMRPLVGKYIDQYGRRKSLLLGLLFYTLVQGLFWYGKDYSIIFLARILHSIASSFLWISSYAMIADLSDRNTYAENYGGLIQASNQGDFLGCIIGFTILFSTVITNAYKTIFGIFSFISLYSLFFGWKNIKETKVKEIDRSDESAETITRQFKLYIVLTGLLALANSMLAPMFLIYLKETITPAIALISLAYIPGEILANFLPRKMGKLSDQYGRKVFMITGMILHAGLVFLIPMLKTIWMFALLNFWLSLAGTLIGPARTALVSQMTSGKRFGRAYASYHTALGIGGIIGPIIGSYIYQNISKIGMFYFNGIATLIIALLFILLIKEKNFKLTNQQSSFKLSNQAPNDI